MRSPFRPWDDLRPEPRVLLALAAIVGPVLGFVGLTKDVLTGETHAFDRAVLLALRVNGDLSRPVSPPWMFLSVSQGSGLETAMKLVFDRARPEVVRHLVTIRSLSFPSGHAMLSAITYLTLAVLLAKTQRERRISIFALASAVLMTLMIGIRAPLAHGRPRRLDRRIDLDARCLVWPPGAFPGGRLPPAYIPAA